jgi:hypothetical protein
MLKKTLIVIFSFGIIAGVSGCATVTPATIRAEKGTGLTRAYAVPKNAIWKAMPEVFSELKLKYIGEDKNVGYLLAESDLAIDGDGELVTVFIDNPDETLNTSVEVIAKNVYNFGGVNSGRNWEIEILNKLHEKLKLSADD